MRRPVFLSEPLRDHLVIGEQGAVEEHEVGVAQLLSHTVGYLGTGRRHDDAASVAFQARGKGGAGLSDGGAAAFEIERNLAGHLAAVSAQSPRGISPADPEQSAPAGQWPGPAH